MNQRDCVRPHITVNVTCFSCLKFNYYSFFYNTFIKTVLYLFSTNKKSSKINVCSTDLTITTDEFRVVVISMNVLIYKLFNHRILSQFACIETINRSNNSK